ncbi:hypothetical protein FRZ67_01805 [Panacibacter ginsenosidivorans]|uniref:Uncharacterized protein n=1 Tax=Panacibacter ginsenosidivorans TaxID=1813871 RepID=A0A5B8V4J9_9BACT|nr:hypothetical protein [Panacibacter ginsenosidivorans]QEC66098.1 hypothetical protein FRZ67_01805 [Panacibacter ginsenosidivorans]
MELDELKSLINGRMERVQKEKSPAEIALLMGRKTQSITGKIKRSLLIELIITIVFTVSCAAITVFAKYHSLRIYFGIFTIISLLFIPLLYLKLNKTRKLTNTIFPVKNNLQVLVKLIHEYIRRYFQLTMALIPLSIIISFILGYTDGNLSDSSTQNSFFSNLIESPLLMTFLIAYIILFSVGMYYFTKWYLKKLYGNYVKQLEDLIAELEE